AGLFAGAGALGALLVRIPMFSIAVNERMIWVAALALSVLAALAIDAWLRERVRGRVELMPILFAATAIAITIAVVFGYSRFIASGLSPAFVRVAAARAIVPLLLAAATMLVIRRPQVAVVLLTILLIGERSAETMNLRPAIDPRALAPSFPGLEAMTSSQPFRIAGVGTLLTPNMATHYELEDVRGYQAMTLARFHDTFPMWSIKQPVWSNRIDRLDAPMLSLMNVRFAIAPPHTTLANGWRRIASFESYAIVENTRALARVFVPT